MKYSKLVHKIHLISSMIIFSFLLMYLLTGIIKINHNLFEIPPVEVSQYTVPVEKMMDGTPREYTKYLEEKYNFRGRINFKKDQKENWVFNFNFPGDNIQITLTPAQDTLHFKQWKQKMTFFTVANRMHVQRGFKGGWAYTTWAVMYDISCFAMIIFAVTGVLMWFRARKRFRYGWWYLAAGILIPMGILCLYVFWK